MNDVAPDFRRRKRRERLTGFTLGAGVFALLLIAWQALASGGLVDPLFSSSPARMLAAGWEMVTDGTLGKNLLVSGRVFLVGYGLAVATGIPIGIALGWFKWISRSLSGLMTFFYTMPHIALMPLFIIWFGLGIGSEVALVLLGAIFPLIVNMQGAMQNIDRDLKLVGKVYGASNWQLFRTIALPSSVPFLLTGLRLALGRGLLSVVAAEAFGGSQGIGYLIQYAGETFRIDTVFAGVVVIALIGVALDRSLYFLSRRVDAWRLNEA